MGTQMGTGSSLSLGSQRWGEYGKVYEKLYQSVLNDKTKKMILESNFKSYWVAGKFAVR